MASQAGLRRIGWQVMTILQRILPRGLYGRAALILLAPIVTIQLVFSLEFIQRQYEDVTQQMTQGVVIDLAFLLGEIEASPTAMAALARVKPLAEALRVTLVLPAGADFPNRDRQDWIDLSGPTIIDTLRQRLPSMVAVDLTDRTGLVRIRFDTRHGPIGVELNRKRMSATNPHQLLVLMIVTSVLMAVIAYAFLRNQLRPITKLAEAAEEFGKGRTVSYRPRGAVEVRAAGRAFLDMRERIERQIEQRTLMLSGVSHDLRTPLTRLRLGLELLPQDAETQLLQRDVIDMERMVEEFLAFVRGDATESAELVDAVALVQGVLALAGGPARLVEVIGRPEPVVLRPQAVGRALENLVSNAGRYGRTVELRLEFRNHLLCFRVEDDGPGIPPGSRTEALKPFARLDRSRDPNQGGGVGLGLSIAADIARSHGGTIGLSQSDRLGGLRVDLVIAR
jgi:two-component system, OmpR family, osmolarity sensor histidine kinase EnvZ